VKGVRLPTLTELLDDPTIFWTIQPVAWYNGSGPHPGMARAAPATGSDYQEVQAHLGVEAQRQLSHRAVARTTLVLCRSSVQSPA
jgi:hypothetical protein